MKQQRSRRNRPKKYRRTLRRKVQRGGYVESLETWKAKVNTYLSEFQGKSMDGYTFANLKKDDISLPPLVKDQTTGVTEIHQQFILDGFPSEPNDIRNIGWGILQILTPLIKQNQNSLESIKPSQFMEFIRLAETFSNEDSLTYMMLAEQLLRGDTIDLKDTKSYPLLIWFLIMNLTQAEGEEKVKEEEQNSVPSLAPVNETIKQQILAEVDTPR